MEFTRQDQEVLCMKNKDGSIFFEAPALDVDLLLSKAQAGIDVTDTFNYDIWLDRFHTLLIETYSSPEAPPHKQFTRQDAWIIYIHCSEAMQRLKKNLIGSVTSQRPTE